MIQVPRILNRKTVLHQVQLIHRAIGTSHDQFRDLLELTDKQYRGFYSLEEDLPADSLLRLFSKLNIGPEYFYGGKVDFALLEKRFKGDSFSLPHDLSIGSYSRRRTSLGLLEFLKANSEFGHVEVTELLYNHQLSWSNFDDKDAFISIKFIRSVADYLSRKFRSKKSLIEAGAMAASINKNSGLAKELQEFKNLKDIHAYHMSMLSFYDLNYKYWVHHLSDTTCVLRSKERDEVKEELCGPFGSHHVCLTKVGVSSTIPALVGAPRSFVTKTSCEYQGDDYCEFVIDFENGNKPFFRSRIKLLNQ